MTNTQGNAKGYPLIRDVPANKDEFGAHQRIADAMVATMEANPDVRTIGLVGPWGSGKSTVLRLFEERVGQDPKSSTTVFTFDVWLHHGEPVRRAFLEAFLRFCNPAKKSTRNRLRAAADQVTGRSLTTETIDEPSVSWGGLLVLASIALGAFGLAKGHALRAVPWIREMLAFLPDWVAILLPGIVPLCAILAVALWRYVVAWDLIRSLTHALSIAGVLALAAGGAAHWGLDGRVSVAGATVLWLASGGALLWRARAKAKRDHGGPPAGGEIDESLLGLILSRQHQSKRTRLSGASTPTAMEFADVFRDAVHSTFVEGHAVVVVIDNLDRLPEAEAKEAWAMLRTFFSALTVNTAAARPAPVVVVPVAEEAVNAIFKVDAKSRGQSFMDKTFDVTFHLPRPVLTRWQDYLAARLNDVFADEHGRDWTIQATRLVDAKYAGAAPPITPRALNALVNQVATVWLQNRGFNIPFATVVYYCLNRDDLDSILLAPENIATVPVDVFDSDWRRNVAALHFGVKPEEAIHVLLGGPIRQAIAARDKPAFHGLFSIPGAPTMVSRLFSTYRDDGTTDKARVLNSVFVFSSIGESDEPRPQFWLPLANVLPTLSWDTLTDEDVTDLLTLFDHVPGHETALLAAVQHGLTIIPRPDIVAPQVQARFWAETYSRKPDAFNGIAPIRVIGSAAGFLDVMQMLDEPTRLRLRMTYASPDEVMKELLAYVTNAGDANDAERRYLAAKRSAIEFDWSSYANQSAKMVQNAGTSSYGNDKASIDRLRAPMLSLVADGQASNLTAQITDILRSKLNWILTSAIGNELWDLAGYTMAAASTYALTSIDSSVAPPEKAWPAIALAFVRAFRLQGLDLVHAGSDIPTPERPVTPMRLEYRRLLEAVSEVLSKPTVGPPRSIGPVGMMPPSG